MKSSRDMEYEKLGKELVGNAQDWRLSMKISDTELEMVVYNPT